MKYETLILLFFDVIDSDVCIVDNIRINVTVSARYGALSRVSAVLLKRYLI